MARKKQETLVLFPEVLAVTRKFTNEQFGALMRAAFAYRFSDEVYSGDDAAVDVAFQMVSNQIDRYAAICATNSDNRKDSDNAQEGEGNPTECHEMQGNPPPIHSISYPDPIPKDVADKPPTRKRFVPPTVQDVAEYCRDKGYAVDAERFVDYYTANGWRVGKNPMRDWQAAARTWAAKEKLTVAPTTPEHCGYTLAPLEDPFETAMRGKRGHECLTL